MARKLSQKFQAVWARRKYRRDPEYAEKLRKKNNEIYHAKIKNDEYREMENLRHRVEGRRRTIDAMTARIKKKELELVPMACKLARLQSKVKFRAKALKEKPKK